MDGEGAILPPETALTSVQGPGIQKRYDGLALLLANRELALKAANLYKHPGSRRWFEEGWNDAQRKRPTGPPSDYYSAQARKAFRRGQDAWREYLDNPDGACRCRDGNHYCHVACLPPHKRDLGGNVE